MSPTNFSQQQPPQPRVASQSSAQPSAQNPAQNPAYSSQSTTHGPSRNPFSARCPKCGEEAPLVYRDFVPTCSACGAMRAPLAGPAVAMAGKPSQVGGTVARIVAWLVLAVGGALAAILFALATWMFPGSPLPWILALPTLAITLGLTFLFNWSGKSLVSSGERKEESVRRSAFEAIARQRGGVVTAADVAGMLRMNEAQTDAWLTALAKSEPEKVHLDFDDQGRVTYRFLAYGADAAAGAWDRKWSAQNAQNVQTAQDAQDAQNGQDPQNAQARVGVPSPPQPHVRVEPPIYDAEFIEDDPAQVAARRSR